MDDCDRVMGRRLASGGRVLVRAVCKAADVHGADGRDVPNRLDHLARIAGARLLRMDHACRPANATVRIRSDATPIESRGGIALGEAKTDQECQPILPTILTEGWT